MVDVLWCLLWLDVVSWGDILQVSWCLPHHLRGQVGFTVRARGSSTRTTSGFTSLDLGWEIAFDRAATCRWRFRFNLSNVNGKAIDLNILRYLFDLLLALHLRFEQIHTWLDVLFLITFWLLCWYVLIIDWCKNFEVSTVVFRKVRCDKNMACALPLFWPNKSEPNIYNRFC